MPRLLSVSRTALLDSGVILANLPLQQTSTSVHLSVQLFQTDLPGCPLAVQNGPTFFVPSSVMEHAVLLGRDSWMRFSNRFYRSLPPHPSDNRIFSELTLSHQAPVAVSTFAIDSPTSNGGCHHLPYDGAVDVTLSDELQLLAVNFVHNTGSPALTGNFIDHILRHPDLLSVEEHLVASRAAGPSSR